MSATPQPSRLHARRTFDRADPFGLDVPDFRDNPTITWVTDGDVITGDGTWTITPTLLGHGYTLTGPLTAAPVEMRTAQACKLEAERIKYRVASAS
jgi:hypothetical protein